MAKIKAWLIVFLSLAVAIAGVLVLNGGITGLFGLESLTSGRLVFPNGTTATLIFDNYSTTYVDHSVANPNVYAELCSNDANTDLLDKFLSIYIVVGNVSIDIGALPAQMVSSRISGGCAVVDEDVSLYTGFFPAIVSFGVSNYSNMSGVEFYDLTMITGFLKGNFTIDPVNETPTNLTINVRFPVDENNNTYYIDMPLIVGVRNSSLDVVDSAITSLDDPVTLSRPNGSYIITINNIDQPGIFVPIVDIITPADGQSITTGSSVLITVSAVGNITQVLINVSWDSTSQLLNATFNSGTGLWEALFTDTAALGLYNITAFAYDLNGGVGNDTSYFFIVAGPSGGGGSGGRASGVIIQPPVVPPPIVPPVVTVPPAIEKAVSAPVAPPAVAAPVAPVAPKVPELPKVSPCFILELLGYVLLVLLIICVLVYVIYKYVLKKPVGKWLEWLIWILIAILIALVWLGRLSCDKMLWWPLLTVILILLFVLFKFLLSKQEKEKAKVEILPEEHKYISKAHNELDKEIMRLEKSIRRLRK
ncbi:Uncharacterised protein [uncultured archaeon]|nr:Uncharacterised protein [uncultured archaeon]